VQVLSNIFSKLVWLVIGLFLFAAGGVVALRFLSPPPVASVPSSQQLPQPTPTTTPAQTEISSPSPSDTSIAAPLQPTTSASPAATATPDGTASTTQTSTTSTNPSSLPAIALPDQVALVAPKKLKPGAILSIYENMDNNSNPDSINYSPTSRKEVDGLTLTNLKRGEFQQVSGYFLAEKNGSYSFVISFPDDLRLDSTNLRLRIDGQPLSNVKGGSVNLERGWHKVDLFYFDDYNNNAASQIQVKWGLEGSDLKRLQVWREAK
jgi:hypothetical protein